VLRNDLKRSEYDQRLKTGNFKQKVYYRPSAAQQSSSKYSRQYRSSYYSTYRKRKKEKPVSPIWKKVEKGFEIFGFSTLLIPGLFAVFRSIYRIINPLKDVDPYPGLVGGLVFSTLLIYFWVMKNKTYDR
jgi:hypothetical protein